VLPVSAGRRWAYLHGCQLLIHMVQALADRQTCNVSHQQQTQP
jgi:hypothetical protein